MENRLWQNEYRLRASDFDKYNRIRLSSVLDLFQDAAGQHADLLGVGFERMLERHYLWVLVRIKLQIISQMHLHLLQILFSLMALSPLQANMSYNLR